MKQTGCRVSLLSRGGHQLEMRVWPRVEPDDRDFDVETDDLPMRFAVEGHPNLTKEQLPTHPILGQRETLDWEINVIKSSEAPIVGVIVNSFKGPADLQSFQGEAYNVTLNPIVEDILGIRARKAVRELGSASAVEEVLTLGKLANTLTPPNQSRNCLSTVFSSLASQFPQTQKRVCVGH